MRFLSNLHVKGKPAVLQDRAIRRHSHYFIYRPRITLLATIKVPKLTNSPNTNVTTNFTEQHNCSFYFKHSIGLQTQQQALLYNLM